MVLTKTVLGWSFSCVGMECSDDGSVSLIYCKTCHQFYTEQKCQPRGYGRVEGQVDKVISGTTVIKKANFHYHIMKSNTHKVAALRLAERENLKTSSGGPSTSSSSHSAVTRQTTLKPLIRRMNALQRDQLTRKFQLAHFIASSGHSFKSYEKFADFDKKFHGVDLGSAYCDDTSCSKMIKYLSVSSKETFVAPLNDSELHYYSLMSDGSSSAKTMDEKELVLIKTCQNGLPKVNVLRLVEPEEGDQHGIKKAIDSAVSSASFSFQRAERESGICTDAAAVNSAAYRLMREELGDHYLLMLCPAYTLELSIKDAFTAIGLDSKCNDIYTSIYYLFKKQI